MNKLLTGSAWNLFGNAAPLLVAVFTLPLVIKGLGTEKFGVLTLIWAFVGYFSFFDFGMARAITHFIAIHLSKNEQEKVLPILQTGISFGLAMGLLAASFMYASSDFIITKFVNVAPEMSEEVRLAFIAVAAGIPIVIIAATLRGVLEGYRRFDIVNKLRAPLGAWTYVSPLIALLFDDVLLVATVLLVIGRLVVVGLYLWNAAQIVSDFRYRLKVDTITLKKLLVYGGWFTVTAIVGPLLVTFDRFVVGNILTAAAVAFYTTPFEVVSRTTIIASALSFALFPNLSDLIKRDAALALQTVSLALRWLFFITLPIYAFLITQTDLVLTIWLGEEFAQKSALPMRLLALGVFINGLAHIPFTVVQSAGRPDWSAKLHIAELIIFIGIVYLATARYGIVGTAAAWLLRSTLDAFIHMVFLRKLLGRSLKYMLRLILLITASMIMLSTTLFFTDAATSWSVLGAVVSTWGASLFYLFDLEERQDFKDKFTSLFRRLAGKNDL